MLQALKTGIKWARWRLRRLLRCARYLPGISPRLWLQAPLLMRLMDMGYLTRARELTPFSLRGVRVLDVGCGSGFYGPVYLLLGARQYTGCDYKLDLDSPLARDYRTMESRDMGITPRQLALRFDGRLDLKPGGWEALEVNSAWDLVLMYLVTEHLMDIESAFRATRDRLAPDGRFAYLHHNFYCWNGHHQAPHTLEEIDPEEEEQRLFVDWAHVRRAPRPDEYIARHLNRIRLDDLRALTETIFEIEEWEEKQTDEDILAQRLTPDVRALLADLTDRDLTTQSVRCVARKR